MRVRRPCPTCGKLRTFTVKRYPDPRWFRTLRAGDVLLDGHGNQRRVLDVKRRAGGALFAIELNRIAVGRDRYSGRVYPWSPTVPYFATELRTRGFRYLGRSA